MNKENVGRFAVVILFALIILACNFYGYAFADNYSTFKGRVISAEKKPVERAEVFVYSTTDTKRPADFISPRTDRHGRFSMTVPRGRYWAVARLRQGEKYGPLMMGDKHSGEPLEIILQEESPDEVVFTVVDIREAARLMIKTASDVRKISGLVTDTKGNNVKMVYVFANRTKELTGMPDYISAWTDERGLYSLYLIPGTYYIGYSKEYPLEAEYHIYREMTVGAGSVTFDIMVHPDFDRERN